MKIKLTGDEGKDAEIIVKELMPYLKFLSDYDKGKSRKAIYGSSRLNRKTLDGGTVVDCNP